jgi:transcriptional regulator with AAA-type ATPase domain
MNISIIQFQKDHALIYKELTLKSSAGLSKMQDDLNASAVWVVPEAALAELINFSDIIENRGTKNKAIELSRILLHGDRITLVNGQFTSAGKLCRSIETFFTKVPAAYQRLFIIGVTDSIFEDLKARSEKDEHPDDCRHLRSKHVAGYGLAALLPPDTWVDDDLRRTYLGTAPEVEDVRLLIVRAAKLNDVVLIMGDTGTGKEIVAHEIHHHGAHPSRPFIPVNCGAFPHDLFESELFGHEKGAFTGAETKKIGLWRTAMNGTLFLDEIGELALDLQAKVLRALQENMIRPVGSEHEQEVHARIIAATNRDLFTMVQEGRFREDLYYRLRGYIIHTPALRDHREDIPILARALWEKIAGKGKAQLSESLINSLSTYSWPGNVRELKMVLTHLHGLFGTSESLEEQHLRIVFAMQGQDLPLKRGLKTSAAATSTDDFSSYRRLRRTYETIRAVEYLLKPFWIKNPSDTINGEISERINLLLEELDSHCRNPLCFAPGTYESINLLRSRLMYFVGTLEGDASGAYHYSRDCVREALDHAISSLQTEFDKALTSI